MNVPQKTEDVSSIMESVLIKGDLSKLTPQERSQYYTEVCKSCGLNPLTQPFEYITLNNKLTLYAKRACTDQLRAIHNVSVVELTETERDGVFIVTAKMSNSAGRTDMSKGAVTIGNLKGDALANALMKAETKAKRRATLSLCGLGFLDETEVETIPPQARGNGYQPQESVKQQFTPPRLPPSPIQPPAPVVLHDPVTGEIKPHEIPWPAPGNVSPPIAWGKEFIDAIRTAKTIKELDDWEIENFDQLDKIRAEFPKVLDRIIVRLNEEKTRLLNEQVPESLDDIIEPDDEEA